VGTQHWIYNVTGSPATSLYKVWTYEDVEYGTQQGEPPVLCTYQRALFRGLLPQLNAFLLHLLRIATGGYLTKFKDGLSFMTVRYAGHEVPAYQPQKALELLRRYLDGSLFDTSRH
jgi:hypothetical protein